MKFSSHDDSRFIFMFSKCKFSIDNFFQLLHILDEYLRMRKLMKPKSPLISSQQFKFCQQFSSLFLYTFYLFSTFDFHFCSHFLLFCFLISVVPVRSISWLFSINCKFILMACLLIVSRWLRISIQNALLSLNLHLENEIRRLNFGWKFMNASTNLPNGSASIAYDKLGIVVPIEMSSMLHAKIFRNENNDTVQM